MATVNVTLTRAVRLPEVTAAGTTLDIEESLAYELKTRGDCVINTPSRTAQEPKPVMATTTITGGSAFSVGEFVKPAKRVAIGIIGQSNERGQVAIGQLATYPQAFRSLNRRGMQAPTNGCVTNQGSPWFKVFDDLFDAGWEVAYANEARGSASIIKHYAGQCEYRNNSQAYYASRVPLGNGDRGDLGSLTVQGGKLFKATTGRARYAQYFGNDRIPNTNQTWIDYVLEVGTQAAAGADPGGWSSATLGSTIADGTVTWTCIDATNSVGYTQGKVFDESNAGLGFDPLGLMLDLHQRMQAIDADEKIIIVCNAQSDTSATSTWYTNALNSIANYYTGRGYKVFLGLSCYNAAGGTDRTTVYNTLQTGLQTALTNQSSNPLVFAGANLYALMGTTGNMSWAAAQAGTGWLQSDGTHLNAQGAIVAGGHWADAIKAALAAG